MKIDEFLDILFLNIPLYLLSLVISLILIIPLFKRFTNGVIDPLFFTLIMTGLANAIPFFLFFTGDISAQMFIYFICAEVLFWIGYSINASKSFVFKNVELVTNENRNLILFYVFLFLFIVLKLTAYALLGVPIFIDDSRLNVFTDTGLGALERFSSFPVFFCSVYVFHLYNANQKHRILAYFTFAIIILFSILSGSKGSIMILVTGFFVYTFFYQQKVFSFKKILYYLPLLFLAPIIVIVLQDANGESNPLETFLIRFIANGDIYFMSLPNNFVDFIHISDRFVYFFKGILSSFRIIDPAQVDINIGIQLGWSINDLIDGSLMGPNTRPPILGWVFFRWGGIVLTFFIGLCASFLIYRPSRLLPKSILSSIYIGYIYYSLLAFIGDPQLAIGAIFEIFINTIVFIFFTALIYKGKFYVIKP